MNHIEENFDENRFGCSIVSIWEKTLSSPKHIEVIEIIIENIDNTWVTIYILSRNAVKSIQRRSCQNDKYIFWDYIRNTFNFVSWESFTPFFPIFSWEPIVTGWNGREYRPIFHPDRVAFQVLPEMLGYRIKNFIELGYQIKYFSLKMFCVIWASKCLVYNALSIQYFVYQYKKRF